MNVRREVYEKFQSFFEDTLKWKTWVGIQNYYNTKDKWPTTQELADFLDESRDNIQPRTSELNSSMAIEKHEKRPCTSKHTEHNISVTTWKIPNVYMEDVNSITRNSSDNVDLNEQTSPIDVKESNKDDVIFG